MNEKMLNSGRTILIIGESGVGKSMTAKELHNQSLRKHQKFIHINIAALSDSLFESEMFGHVRGAFTGATEKKVGFCEEVGGGTLFIDEIGELSLRLQAKLLTLLEERTYYAVGSTVQKSFRGSIYLATHCNLEQMVAEGKFREDLYFRIRYFQLDLPPLRERKNLFSIINDEINKNRFKYREEQVVFSAELVEFLVRYEWPGNFRELKSTIEYFFLLGNSCIGLDDVPSWMEKKTLKSLAKKSYYQALEEFEKSYFQDAFIKCRGKTNLTAQMTGISKATLISKVKKYGIDRDTIKKMELIKTAHGF